MSLPGSKKKGDASGSDGRFFTTTKKGEVHELRMEINSPNRDKKMDAVKKVRARPPAPDRIVCPESTPR